MSATVNAPCQENGVDITAEQSGSVKRYTSVYTSCSTKTTANAIWLGSGGKFTYTLIFSKPIIEIEIAITATGFPVNENFIFSSNGDTPTITSSNSCFTTIEKNQLFSGMESNGVGGGGNFTIKSSKSFTKLTISGDGGSNGSILAIGANSLKAMDEYPSPSFEKEDLYSDCGEKQINISKLKAKNTPSGLKMTLHTSFPPTKSNLTEQKLLNEGIYYSTFYDKKKDSFSLNYTELKLKALKIPQIFAGEDKTICEGTDMIFQASGAKTYNWNNNIEQNKKYRLASSKAYIVQGMDEFGCFGFDTLNLVIKPAPKVYAGDDISTYKGKEITLSASGAQTFSWNKGVEQGLAFIPKSTSYAVTGTDKNGCSASDEVIVKVENYSIEMIEEIPINEFSEEDFKPVNVVFVLDISNSMASSDKLKLLKIAVGNLGNLLRPQDKISMVTYSNYATVLLDPVSGSNKGQVLEVVEQLKTIGSTAGVDGIKLGYKLAGKNFIENGTNLIVLITDGNFNDGKGNVNKIIQKNKKKDLQLSVVGVKNNPIDEHNMRTAAEYGGGRYVPVFNVDDAEKNLIYEIKKHTFLIK